MLYSDVTQFYYHYRGKEIIFMSHEAGGGKRLVAGALSGYGISNTAGSFVIRSVSGIVFVPQFLLEDVFLVIEWIHGDVILGWPDGKEGRNTIHVKNSSFAVA